MTLYFDLKYQDTIHSSNGSNHIVLTHWTTSDHDPAPQVSQDCGTFGEMNHVIDAMIADLEAVRKKAMKHFDKLQAARPTPLGLS